MHLAAIVVAVVLVVAAYVFLFKALNEHFELQHEINAKLPPNRKFEPLFWSFVTRRTFRELQKEVLPDSPRLKRSFVFRLLFFLFFFSALVLLAFGLGRLHVSG